MFFPLLFVFNYSQYFAAIVVLLNLLAIEGKNDMSSATNLPPR